MGCIGNRIYFVLTRKCKWQSQLCWGTSGAGCAKHKSISCSFPSLSFARKFHCLKRVTCFSLFFSLLCFGLPAVAQTIITGRVTDAQTGEPIPFANVFITGKYQGVTTDMNGDYRLDTRQKTDSLTASSLGYTAVTKKVAALAEQVLNFELQSESFNIREIVVKAGDEPAVALFKKIVAAKPLNNPRNFRTFQYESYNKYQVDLDNITGKDIDKNLLLKGFDFLKEYIDTLSETGKSTLPIFLIEQVSDNYEQSEPKKTIEFVKGQKLTMLRDNPMITELAANANQQFNLYDNLMSITGKNFISPIADYGLSVYKYDLNQFDTLYIYGQPHFMLKFKPKRKGDNAFTGEMAINLSTYAVSSIQAGIPEDVALGYIRDFYFLLDFMEMPRLPTQTDSATYTYVPAKEIIRMRMRASVGKGMDLVIRKTKSFQNQKLDEPIDENVFDPYKKTIVLDSAYTRADIFWDTIRHEKLNDTEAGVYEMVDSLKKTSKFKVIKYSLSTLVDGYAKIGPIGLGHVANIFSRNQVEGWRFRLGIKTNRDFSERWQLQAYLAYGIDDNRFKYGGKCVFIVSKKPWHKLTLSGRTDVDLMSRHAEEMDPDNVFTLVQKKDVTQRLYNIEEMRLLYDNEFYKDMTSYLGIQYRTMNPYFPFYYEEEGIPVDKIVTSELGYAIRWQHKSQSLPGTFDRDAKATRFFAQFRKKTDFPVVWAKYILGLPNIGNSQFRYHDVSLGFQGDVTVTAKQSFYYNLWFGKIFGTLPFLLLKNPEGNFHHVHNKYFFNNMNLLEFSADQYASLNFQYFFGGWIGDQIPLVKKLKLRAVATTNIFYGTVSDENQQVNAQNNVGIAHPIPYVEAGFGIENILRFIRIDCIWRVTQRNRPESYNFGVYASLFIKV